jgi:hypothetical protein
MGDGDGSAFECLTLDAMRKFNEITLDKPGVQYFSWGAQYEPGLIDTWKYVYARIRASESLPSRQMAALRNFGEGRPKRRPCFRRVLEMGACASPVAVCPHVAGAKPNSWHRASILAHSLT